MTPRDFALEIEPKASPERLNEIEQVIQKVRSNERCYIAADLNDPRWGPMYEPLNKDQFADWLRWTAQLLLQGIPLP